MGSCRKHVLGTMAGSHCRDSCPLDCQKYALFGPFSICILLFKFCTGHLFHLSDAKWCAW